MIIIILGSSSFAGIVINTTFTIGRKSQNCAGLGICSATSTTVNNDGSINGSLDLNVDRGSLIISINRSDLINVQPEKLAYFENKSEVTFAEDFTFPEEIKTALQLSTQLILKKGAYNISLKNGKYCIEVPL